MALVTVLQEYWGLSSDLQVVPEDTFFSTTHGWGVGSPVSPFPPGLRTG